MKLLKSAVFGMMLALPMFVFSGSSQANGAYAFSVERFQFPGDDEEDWRIIFHLYTNYSPDPNQFIIYGWTVFGNWRDITQDVIGQSPAWYECKADFVSITFNPSYPRYEVVYRMGDRMSYWPPACLGLSNPQYYNFYLDY